MVIFGDGRQTRDFIFVKDVVAANIFLPSDQRPREFSNVASGQHITVNELAATIHGLTASTSQMAHAADVPAT